MKKTLLMAAAALAAGIITSQAQPVYSQNIVGYANVVTLPGNNLMSVPFLIGASNGYNEVFGNVPEFSQILIWDKPNSAYIQIQRDTGSSTGWSLVSDSSEVPVGRLPVGQGFFFAPNTAYTNTFAGTVAVMVGTSNVMALPTGNNLVGLVVPYAGAVTNGNSSGGGANISIAGGIPEFSQLLIWNKDNSSYQQVQIDTGSSTGWSLVSDSSEVPVPSVSVAQGFFFAPNTPSNWTMGL